MCAWPMWKLKINKQELISHQYNTTNKQFLQKEIIEIKIVETWDRLQQCGQDTANRKIQKERIRITVPQKLKSKNIK